MSLRSTLRAMTSHGISSEVMWDLSELLRYVGSLYFSAAEGEDDKLLLSLLAEYGISVDKDKLRARVRSLGGK